jgi:hypothetical protein
MITTTRIQQQRYTLYHLSITLAPQSIADGFCSSGNPGNTKSPLTKDMPGERGFSRRDAYGKGCVL